MEVRKQNKVLYIHISRSVYTTFNQPDCITAEQRHCKQQPISLRVMQGSRSISSLNIQGGACAACSCTGLCQSLHDDSCLLLVAGCA